MGEFEMTDDQTQRVDVTAEAPGRAPGFEAPASAVTTPRPNRLRWVAGLGIAGAAVALAVGALVLFGSEPTPEALRYIPGDAAVVVEVRPELPGDQMQNVGNLLAHFPGFKDQSTLAAKIDEALSRAANAVETQGVDYQGDIKPWISGPLFVGVRDFGAEGETGGKAPKSFVVSATTTGAVGCAQVMEGKTVQTETYRNLEIQSATATQGEHAGETIACAAEGRQVLVGDPASVRAGIDAKSDGTGIDKDAGYKAASGQLKGDQLATVYIDGASISALIPKPSEGATTPGVDAMSGLSGGLTAFGSQVPDWAIAGVRAESDALVIDSVAAPLPAPSGSASQLPLPPTHPSVLAGMLPADTVLLVENQGTGVALQNVLGNLPSTTPTSSPEIPELEEALGMLQGLGGGGELVGWIEDAGIAVVGNADSPSGGLLLVAKDDASATKTVGSINSLIALAGLQGLDLTTTKETVAGVDVTKVVLSDIGSLVPPGSLPGGAEPPAGQEVELSFAAKGRVVLIGVGDSFMSRVLGTQAGASLADQPEFKAAAARSLANSRTSIYVGVPAALELYEAFLPAEKLAEWQEEYAPYVAPLDVVAVTTTSDGTGNRSRVVVTVGQP